MIKDIFNLDIEQTSKRIRDKEFSLYELTNFYLDRIDKYNSEYNVFLTLNSEAAKKYAKRFDNSLEEKFLLPYALKDNIITKDIRTTCASKILENFIPTYDATVAKKLKDKGGILLGKTNMDEFGHGSSTENSAFGPVKNPYDKTRVSGGSSGGSAAAVAMEMAHFALGSDTGSSVRQPAAFCGVVGLKPTYGRVSRFGLVAMASSMDQIGPITKNVKDSARVFEYISGADKHDATSVADAEGKNAWDEKAKLVKTIGVPKEFFGEGLSSDVKSKVEEAIEEFSKLGYKIKKISIPHSVRYSLAVYYLQQTAEVSSNLSRFDGVKYGYAVKNPEEKNLFEYYSETRGEGFGAEAKRRIILGTFVLSAGYQDAYYKQAARVRGLIKKEFDEAFSEVDVIVAPTTPTLPFKIGEKAQDPLAMYMSDIYTVPANLTGMPAISIPCGFVGNLPVGLQIMAPAFREDLLFEVAYKFEQKHDYWLRRSDI